MNPVGISRTGCGDLKAEGGGMDSQVSSTFVSLVWEETRAGAESRDKVHWPWAPWAWLLQEKAGIGQDWKGDLGWLPCEDSGAEPFTPPLDAANCEEDGPGQRASRSIPLAMDWEPRHLGLPSPHGRWPTFHFDSAAHWTGLKTAVHKAFPWVRCISSLLSAFPGAVTTP